MRGKARLATRKASPTGITPAYAGKSTHAGKLRESSKDHPRLCGEKNSSRPLERRHTGSPPPMRGKAGNPCIAVNPCRITPAYAGKRLVPCPSPSAFWDHPRLCGEKIFSLFNHAPQTGSPPPMRGKVLHFARRSVFFGITPAYAGKSFKWSERKHIAKDHPRLCGEKTKKIPKQRYFFHQPASFSFSLQYT